MKIKNKHINIIVSFLTPLPLPGKKSRMRYRFIKLCEKQLEQIDEDRKVLIDRFAEKDEEEKIVTQKNEDNQQVIILSDPIAFNTEINELMEEYWVIDETESHEDMLVSMADTILEYDEVLEGQNMVAHAELCDAFEELSYE